LGVKLYKCDPYCSFQRGTNERTNALVRRWIPKGIDMKDIKVSFIKEIENWINNLLRPMFGFKSSLEMAKLAL